MEWKELKGKKIQLVEVSEGIYNYINDRIGKVEKVVNATNFYIELEPVDPLGCGIVELYSRWRRSSFINNSKFIINDRDEFLIYEIL